MRKMANGSAFLGPVVAGCAGEIRFDGYDRDVERPGAVSFFHGKTFDRSVASPGTRQESPLVNEKDGERQRVPRTRRTRRTRLRLRLRNKVRQVRQGRGTTWRCQLLSQEQDLRIAPFHRERDRNRRS